MKILIHASLDFVKDLVFAQNLIEGLTKHEVLLPELTRYQYIRDEQGDDEAFTKIKNRLTKDNISNVEKCDCLLILNHNHRGIENYVGGNSFIEMIIAFYLKKPIYLLHEIPEGMAYTEEIKALFPVIVHDIESFISIVSQR